MATPKNNKLNVQIVLDRSGSMADCWEDALKGVNTYVKELAGDENIKARVSVVVFDSQSIDEVRSNVKAREFDPVTDEDCLPRGMTPLLDAVGQTITKMDGLAHDKRNALVIMTDGHENASVEFKTATISKMVQDRQAKGWLITYLGADHDAWDQARHLGFAASHTADFSKGAMGEVAASLSVNTRAYASAITLEDGLIEASYSDEQRKQMRGDPKST